LREGVLVHIRHSSVLIVVARAVEARSVDDAEPQVRLQAAIAT
jgi:hypothetical protein